MRDLYNEDFLNKFDVISFDVFDTLLLRDTGNHLNLWKSKSRTFALARALAEVIARVTARMKHVYEVNQVQIYRIIGRKWKFEEEVALEDSHLFLNPEIAERIRELKNSGKKIILVSDTHFSSEIINSWLTSRGLPDVKIFTSQEILKPKSKGLFEFVKTNLGIDYSSWLHIGDNVHSDVAAPNILGISSIYYPKLRDQVIDSGIISKRGFAKIIRRQTLGQRTFRKFLEGFANLQLINKRSDLELENLIAILFSNSISQSIAKKVWEIGSNQKLASFWFVSRDGWLPFLSFTRMYPDAKAIYFRTSRSMMKVSNYSDYVRTIIQNDDSVLIYDLGWRGSTLKELHNIAPEVSWFGVFLGLLNKIHIPNRRLFTGTKSDFFQIWRGRDLLEVIYSEAGESYAFLGAGLEPLRRETRWSPLNETRVRIATFAELGSNLEIMALTIEQASLLLTTFVAFPNIKLINLFSKTTHDTNGVEAPLVHSSWKTLFSKNPVMWPQAARLLNPNLGLSENLVFRFLCFFKEVLFRFKSFLGRGRSS